MPNVTKAYAIVADKLRRQIVSGKLPPGAQLTAERELCTDFGVSRITIRHAVRLLAEEGLCLGLSSGINVAGAVALGRQLGRGSRVATILCDTGFRYLSSLYNPAWLREKGLPVFPWLAA